MFLISLTVGKAESFMQGIMYLVLTTDLSLAFYHSCTRSESSGLSIALSIGIRCGPRVGLFLMVCSIVEFIFFTYSRPGKERQRQR